MNAPTLPGRVLDFAAATPTRTALRVKELGRWREIGWREYADDVAATAAALAAWGVGPGDHVAILSDNGPEWLYADLAAQGLGARAVGIYQTNPPEDVAYILQHCGATVLFAEDQEQVDKAVAIANETPALQHVVVFDPRGTRGLRDARLVPWDEFLAAGRAHTAAEPSWFANQVAARDPHEPTMVVYTSGTTGPPKGALLSARNVLVPAASTVGLLGLSEDDTLLSYLPLCHVAEKIFSQYLPLSTGAVVHFGEAIETVQSDLREVSPTVFLGVPRIWEKIHASVVVKMGDASWLKRTLFRLFVGRGEAIARRRREGTSRWWDPLVWRLGDLLVFRPLQERLGLRRCRLAVSGAAPIGPQLLSWYHGIGVEILEGYGQTECAGVSHLNRPGAAHIGSVGQALPGVECVLAPDGEILVRGEHVFAGYLHDSEATARAVDAAGWLHTGDIGQIDDQGYLRITGRKKEILITSGGKNLSPEKIENALKHSPYVKEAVAVGDGRKFVSALIQIEYEAVADWATRRGIPFTSFGDLSARPEVVELIDGAVQDANEHLARVEQVRAFRLFARPLNQDDGELTATQKVRRQAVLAAYDDLVASIYGGTV